MAGRGQPEDSELHLEERRGEKSLQAMCTNVCASAALSRSVLDFSIDMIGAEINQYGHIPKVMLPGCSVGPGRPLADVMKVLISVQPVVEGTYRTQ